MNGVFNFKRAAAGIAVSLYIFSAVFAFGCGAGEHEHVYSRWTGVDSHHYRICECGDIKRGEHVWDGDKCLICRFAPEYTVNAAYMGVYEGNELAGYTLTGRGKAEGDELILPATYDGLPVSVGDNAFTGDSMTRLTTLGAQIIGENAFSFCPLLSSVKLGNGLISLGQNAFSGCAAIKNVELPQSLESIGKSVFSGCSSLREISVPDGVEEIYANTFMGCTALEKVEIGKGVKNLDELAFFSCPSLKEISVSEQNSAYRSSDNCIIEISSQKLILGGVSGRVASGVKVIGSNSFQSRYVIEAYIPKSVERVEIGAFSGCMSIAVVYYEGNAEDWGKIVFEGGNGNLTGADIQYNYNFGDI